MSFYEDDDQDHETEGYLMQDVEAIKRFVLAGRAHLTLQSDKTGRHYTYRIKQAVNKQTNEPEDVWFVSRLTVADGGDFAYLGMIKDNEFKLTKNSKLPESAKPVLAWKYFWKWIQADKIAPYLAVLHEGRCGRCGRTLTHPESIESGIGPECASIMGRGPELPADSI